MLSNHPISPQPRQPSFRAPRCIIRFHQSWRKPPRSWLGLHTVSSVLTCEFTRPQSTSASDVFSIASNTSFTISRLFCLT